LEINVKQKKGKCVWRGCAKVNKKVRRCTIKFLTANVKCRMCCSYVRKCNCGVCVNTQTTCKCTKKTTKNSFTKCKVVNRKKRNETNKML